MSEVIETELVIIGAGPSGLFAAFEAEMLNINGIHVVESLDTVGGQCANLYPDKAIFDMPGHLQISGKELAENLYQQAKQLGKAEFDLNTNVTGLTTLADGRLQLTTNRGKTFIARSIIIAGGVGGFAPQKPDLANLAEFEEQSVFYKVDRVEKFAGRQVLIAGGGDSAIDWAMALLDTATRVGIVHRRNEFRCSPANAEKIQQLASAGKLDVYTPYQLQSLAGTQGKLQTITLSNISDPTITKTVTADSLIVLFGLVAGLGKIAEWGLELEKNKIVVTPLTMATNIKGVFAVGDIVSYPHKLKLVHMGCAEASLAVRSAYAHLYPEAKLGEVHSSSVLSHSSAK